MDSGYLTILETELSAQLREIDWRSVVLDDATKLRHEYRGIVEEFLSSLSA